PLRRTTPPVSVSGFSFVIHTPWALFFHSHLFLSIPLSVDARVIILRFFFQNIPFSSSPSLLPLPPLLLFVLFFSRHLNLLRTSPRTNERGPMDNAIDDGL